MENTLSNGSTVKNGHSNPYPLLVLGALGVVFGDIGTSPLYTLQNCFFGMHSLPLTPENILGIASAVIWTLLLVVSVKYIALVMRADNRGEGGCLALTTLADSPDNSPRKRFFFATLGILGASLLFSDGVITPAISVLSAVEGLTAVNPAFGAYIIPVSLGVLALLFIIQSKGTGNISIFFGPVMLLWFLTLAVLGVSGIVRHPGILFALNPFYALQFLVHNGKAAFFILGSVFLAVTGAEMLYTDIGHFGKSPIRFAWLLLAFPALILNYLGQSALLLAGKTGDTPVFYSLCPSGLLLPLILLATTATIIASQAVISGMFSLTRQAIHLDYWPRLRQIHTSVIKVGQVYIPFINFMLFAGTVALVLYFRQSGGLASAYGIAVSADMIITTGLITYIAWKRWKYGRWVALGMILVFAPIDFGFLAANAAKVASGGWVVLVIFLVLYLLMSTWRRGRRILRKRTQNQSLDIGLFVKSVSSDSPTRVPGVAVFLTGNSQGTPRSLLHNFKHNKIIHEMVFLVSVIFEEVPSVEPQERIRHRALGEGFHRVDLHYGFFESADVPATLQKINIPGFAFKPLQVTYFVGRESLVITRLRTMQGWRKRIFRFLSMNALDASEYFKLPPNRVVEIGLQVEM
ncbi:MAG: potassium transporter Kup [Fibrobacterota bacterium]